MRFLTISLLTWASLLPLVVTGLVVQGEEMYPGVWASGELRRLPAPASGYQLYLLGEMHGVRETEQVLEEYLKILNQASGLRDLALEEGGAYQAEAEAYVEGKVNRVSHPLCLRTGFLNVVRRLNEGRAAQDRIRLHLVDIDTSAAAVRQHLMSLRQQITGAAQIPIPDPSHIADEALAAVQQLKLRTTDPNALRELRTVTHSIRAVQQGLEIGMRGFKGSPYLEDREEAIKENIRDLLGDPTCRGVLAIYGADHVSKALRKDGGPNRDQAFAPMALRLEDAGVKVFSVVMFPLSGRWRWRGNEGEWPWKPEDGRLSSGETLDHLLAAAREATLFYVDRRREQISLPSSDMTRFRCEAFLLLAHSTALDNGCPNP